MKTVGTVLVMSACMLAGFFFASAGELRVRNLRALCLLLSAMRREMMYRQSSLAELIKGACEREEMKKLAFLPVCCELFESGEPFAYAWRTSLEQKGRLCLLNGEDIGLLCAFGDALGTTDCEGQLSLIDDYSEIFSLRSVQARESAGKYGKLCRSLGLLAAAGAAIILI